MFNGLKSLGYEEVNDDAEVIAEKYAIDVLNEGIFAGEGCQGYGLQKTYFLHNSTKEAFENNEGVNWGCNSTHGTQVFIYEKAVEQDELSKITAMKKYLGMSDEEVL